MTISARWNSPPRALRVAAGCALLLAPPALADESASADDEGVAFYLELAGGSTRSQDQDASFDGSASSASGDVDFKNGFLFGGALGVHLRQLRAEIDAHYRDANVEAVTLSSVQTGTSGELKVLSGLFNLYVDIDLDTGVTPFLGGGVGVAKLEMDAFRRPGVFLMDDDATEFAWNLMAGVSIAVSDSLDLLVRYRRFATTEATFDASFPSAMNTGKLDMDFSANEFEMGVRFTF